ncbi:MAG: hypothetical protein WED34_18275 [Planctomycetales bacterium]
METVKIEVPSLIRVHGPHDYRTFETVGGARQAIKRENREGAEVVNLVFSNGDEGYGIRRADGKILLRSMPDEYKLARVPSKFERIRAATAIDQPLTVSKAATAVGKPLTVARTTKKFRRRTR